LSEAAILRKFVDVIIVHQECVGGVFLRGPAPHCRIKARVTKIHRNKAAIGFVESDFITREVKAIFVLFEGVANRHYLLRYDRHDLNVDDDTVEFVEAGPHSSLCKSRAEFLQHLMIKSLTRPSEDVFARQVDCGAGP